MPSLWQREIEKRREKARAEKYVLTRRAEAASRLEYVVGGSTGSIYAVVVDQVSVREQSCTCPDFVKSGLGTCKHIEAVRIEAGLAIEDPAAGPQWDEPAPDLADRDFTLPPGVVCFDVETLHLFNEVGGRSNIDRLGLAVAVTYDSTTDRYESFLEAQARDLITKLTGARMVVGYNIIRFDYPVLQPYTTHRLDRLPTLDLMVAVSRGLDRRPALDSVASLTLGYGKSGHGIEAVEWFRQGQIERVTAYCQDDVRLVRNLLGFALENGYLRCLDGGRPVHVDTTQWARRLARASGRAAAAGRTDPEVVSG